MRNLKVNLCYLIALFFLQTLQAQSTERIDGVASTIESPSLRPAANGVFPLQTPSQEVWQADMSVKMTQENSGYQIYTISITCTNDDDCRSPKLIFTLPRQSQIRAVVFDSRLKSTAYSIMGAASQRTASETLPIDGYVQVDFPNLPKGTTTFKISIELTEDAPITNDGASVMVYSNTPELNKQNNFFYLPLSR